MTDVTLLNLPESLDLRAVEPLRGQLLALRGTAVELNGSNVRRLGALGLQVLMAAARQWASDGQSFRLIDPSAEMRAGLKLLGAPEPATFLTGA